MDQRTNKKWFFMWLKKAMKALEDGTISANTFAVLVVLSQRADYDSGSNARPGNARLASLTGLSEGTVSIALKEGRAAGVIVQVRRGFSNGGSGRNSVYRMDWSASKPAPMSAPSNSDGLPSVDRDLTEISESHDASSIERPPKVRRVKKPSARPRARISADDDIDWASIGLTRREAYERNLTRQDFNNAQYLRLEEEMQRG